MKVAVFAGGVDTSATETKGTVLIHTAEEVNLIFFLLIILLKERKLKIYYFLCEHCFDNYGETLPKRCLS